MKKQKGIIKSVALISLMIFIILSIVQVKVYAYFQGYIPSGELSFIFGTSDKAEISNGYEGVPNHIMPGMTTYCQNHGEMTDKGITVPGEGISDVEDSDFSDTSTCKDRYEITLYEGLPHNDRVLDHYDPVTGKPVYYYYNHPLSAEQQESNEKYNKIFNSIPKNGNGPTYVSYTPSKRPKELPGSLAFLVSGGGSIAEIQEGIWQWLAEHPDYQEKNDAWGFGSLEGSEMSSIANAYEEFDEFIKKNGGFSQTINAYNYNKITGKTSKKHLIESIQDGVRKFTYTDTQIAVDKSNGEEFVLRTILCRLFCRRNSTTRSRISRSN